jgi:RNA binding exosome subunit
MGDIHNIVFRAIARATESEDRVKTALSLFIFNNEIETIVTEGHFGNRITIMKSRLKGRDCNRFIDVMKSGLSEPDFQKLRNELYDRVDDECVLHIRLDKQTAYSGAVKLASSAADTIIAEIKLRAYPARPDNAIAIAENIFRRNS